MSRQVEVVSSGALTTMQDLGRPRLAHLGIPRSGAADRGSLMLANRLVGNPEDSVCLETTVIGPRLKLLAAATFALTGAAVDAKLDRQPVAMNSPVHAPAGSVLAVGPARRGLRTYIAFRGGIVCEPTFGSCSTDVHSGLGPKPIAAADLLTLGVPARALPGVDLAPTAGTAEEPLLRVVLGPRDDMFTTSAVEQLLSEPFLVTTEVSRVGARLSGPTLEREDHSELLSEPVVSGAIQVPPDGNPIILLTDGPTTGGYPVIAVIRSEDLAVAGQLRPGQSVHFRAQKPAR
jgi:biotin-dependent carboxylase-like uncharacterized protein